jgi:hypothetical protein
MSTRQFNIVGSLLVVEELLTNPTITFNQEINSPSPGYRDILITTDAANSNKLNDWCEQNDALCLTWPLDESDLP